MKLLLDTNALIWANSGHPRISGPARTALEYAHVVYVSVVSAWEIAIKQSRGKLRLPESIEEGMRKSSFSPLPATFAHAEAFARLPIHHGDPFDRMLIAQAQVEGLTIITGDRAFEPYDVKLLLI
jgi:PIN domain nuclease of toxin-antitoxin system